MPPIDETPSFEPSPSASTGRKPKGGATDQPSASDLISVTIDASTGRIVSVEGADAAGARRELSEDERKRLAKADHGATLRRVVEQAFEAGVACALGDRVGEGEPPETDEDAELSRMLLESLIRGSAAERLMQREILGRALIGTLIEHAAAPEASAPH